MYIYIYINIYLLVLSNRQTDERAYIHFSNVKSFLSENEIFD